VYCCRETVYRSEQALGVTLAYISVISTTSSNRLSPTSSVCSLKVTHCCTASLCLSRIYTVATHVYLLTKCLLLRCCNADAVYVLQRILGGWMPTRCVTTVSTGFRAQCRCQHRSSTSHTCSCVRCEVVCVPLRPSTGTMLAVRSLLENTSTSSYVLLA